MNGNRFPLKNMVFDMGGVLLRYDPEYFIEREGIADGDRELMMKLIYASREWSLMDRGEMTEEQLEGIVRPQIPERLHEAAHRLIFDFFDPMEPIPQMAEFIRECREDGMGIYLVSNASLRHKTYWQAIPGSEYFDGIVVSAYEKCAKPHPKIFRRLLARYGLTAEECMFVDDVQANADAAAALGMRCFHFHGDVAALRKAYDRAKGTE